ncbi:hypothetical protein BDV59DRAFT_169051 [Aspergillus ambiguus]|uniref:uncharacterized protein n=1 Tax=Aspergillus ambiguus TaxID=176160 RepID=UPI003CCDD699
MGDFLGDPRFAGLTKNLGLGCEWLLGHRDWLTGVAFPLIPSRSQFEIVGHCRSMILEVTKVHDGMRGPGRTFGCTRQRGSLDRVMTICPDLYRPDCMIDALLRTTRQSLVLCNIDDAVRNQQCTRRLVLTETNRPLNEAGEIDESVGLTGPTDGHESSDHHLTCR